MHTNDRIVIGVGRKNAGVSDNQENYSGKKYINNEIRLASETYLQTLLFTIFSLVKCHSFVCFLSPDFRALALYWFYRNLH